MKQNKIPPANEQRDLFFGGESMKMPNGYGSVVRMPRRRRKPYAARVTVGWTDDGKQIKKYLGTFQTRQEALNALANYNQSPYDVDLRKLTFAEVYELWCNYKFKGEPVKSVYVAAYKNLAALHEQTFSKLRKRHMQVVIDSCPLKTQAKSHMKSVCSQMFKYAIDMEITATNYAALVELPTKEESQLHKPFSREELAALWQSTETLGAKVALILCYTGLRPTELARIKTVDVDLPARHMRGGIKTAAGKNRLIPLAEKILPLIEWFYNPANEYLLTVEGKAIRNVSDLRSRIWDKCPLLKGHLPHDGRHTCATLMDDAEIPLKIKQLILGHSAQDITSKVYTHKTVEQLTAAINRI